MSAMHPDAPRPRPSPAVTLAFPALVLALCACSAPDSRPLEPAELAASVAARAATPAELERALELADIGPLAVPAPDPQDLDDPALAGFWHACAWAYAPGVRAARRALLAARASQGSAGQPGPVDAAVETDDLGDTAMHTKVMLTFDLLGLLGIGPSASARALADAQTRSALGELEEAVWEARFEVDAARARLSAARAARSSLAILAEEASGDRTRIAALEGRGRLDAGARAAAEIAERALARRLALLEIEETRAAEDLARAAGLPPTAPALGAPGPEMLAALAPPPEPGAATAEELLERLPALRRSLLDYSVAEARLRDEAAARWPSLRLGPQLLWEEGDLLYGALAISGLPWPGSLDGRIAAASQEREAARERVEDALLAAQARAAGASQRLAAARGLLERDALPAAEQSARLWSAARARFSVEPMALMEWASALRMRAEVLADVEEARAELALSGLELEQARGPAPADVRIALSEEARP